MKLSLEGGDGGERWWAEFRNGELGLLFALRCQHHRCENNQGTPSARTPPGTFQLSLHMQNSAPVCNTTPSTGCVDFVERELDLRAEDQPLSPIWDEWLWLLWTPVCLLCKRENVNISWNYCFGSARYRIWPKCSVRQTIKYNRNPCCCLVSRWSSVSLTNLCPDAFWSYLAFASGI